MIDQSYFTQLSTILTTRAQEQESPWLYDFEVGVRGLIEPQFQWNPDSSITVENCNYLHPSALTAFSGGHRTQAEGFALEDFARGAATIASVLSINDADRLADLIKEQLEVMDQRIGSYANPYPNIAEEMFESYTSCVTIILLGEENTTWKSLLAYALGFLWMLGLVELTPANHKAITDVLLQVAKRGTYY